MKDNKVIIRVIDLIRLDIYLRIDIGIRCIDHNNRRGE